MVKKNRILILFATVFSVVLYGSGTVFIGGSSGGGSGNIVSINGSTVAAQVIDASTPIEVNSSGGTTTVSTTTIPIAKGGTNNASLSVTNGTVYYGDGSKLVGLAPGTEDDVLTMGAAVPAWSTPAAGGGIASINADTTSAQVIAGTAPITANTAGGTTTVACTAATTSTAGCVSNTTQSFSGVKTFLDGATLTSTKSLLWSADNGAASDIGASGSGRPANIRVGTGIYFGTNADADAGSIKSATGSSTNQKRLILSSPGDEIRVDVEGSMLASFFRGSGLSGLELKTTLAFNVDNTYDIGHYHGSTTAIRPKDVFIANGLEVGGSTTVATPSVGIVVNNGFAMPSSGTTTLAADDETVTVGKRSHVVLASDSAVAGDRTFVLSNGLTSGHVLVLEWSGTNAAEIVAASNLKISATWTPTQYDTLSLIWSTSASAWLETAHSTN